MADVTFFAVFIVIFDQLAAAAVRPPAARRPRRHWAKCRRNPPEIKF